MQAKPSKNVNPNKSSVIANGIIIAILTVVITLAYCYRTDIKKLYNRFDAQYSHTEVYKQLFEGVVLQVENQFSNYIAKVKQVQREAQEREREQLATAEQSLTTAIENVLTEPEDELTYQKVDAVLARVNEQKIALSASMRLSLTVQRLIKKLEETRNDLYFKQLARQIAVQDAEVNQTHVEFNWYLSDLAERKYLKQFNDDLIELLSKSHNTHVQVSGALASQAYELAKQMMKVESCEELPVQSVTAILGVDESQLNKIEDSSSSIIETSSALVICHTNPVNRYEKKPCPIEGSCTTAQEELSQWKPGFVSAVKQFAPVAVGSFFKNDDQKQSMVHVFAKKMVTAAANSTFFDVKSEHTHMSVIVHQATVYLINLFKRIRIFLRM